MSAELSYSRELQTRTLDDFPVYAAVYNMFISFN